MLRTEHKILIDPKVRQSFAGVRNRVKAAVAAQPHSVSFSEALIQTQKLSNNKNMEKKSQFTRLVVCAAILNKTNGIKICGPRHGNCLNVAIESGIDTNPGNDTWELGFVDQDNKFMSRAEAWKVADAAGLIRRPTGFELDYSRQRELGKGDEGLLFSECLY